MVAGLSGRELNRPSRFRLHGISLSYDFAAEQANIELRGEG
jgi:hypothetical protein